MAMYGQYRPMATGKRKPYVRPGRRVCGTASCAMKPAAAMEKPDMMNGERCCTYSPHQAQIMTMIMAAT